MKHRLFHGKQFIRSFFSYLLVLMTGSLIANALFCNSTLQNNKTQALEKQQEHEQALADLVDEQLYNMAITCEKINSLYWVSKLNTNAPIANKDFDPIARMHIVDELSTFTGGGNLYEQIILIFPQQDSVVSQSGWFTIDNYFQFIGDDKRQPRLKDTIYNKYNYEIVYSGQPETVDWPYLWLVYTPNKISVPHVQIIFQINKQALMDYLRSIFPDDLSGFTLSDASGNTIEQVIRSQPAASGKILTLGMKSKYFGWNYIFSFLPVGTAIPLDKFFPLLFSIMICAVIGPMLAYFLASVGYRPLQKILSKLQTDVSQARSGHGGMEYSLLENYIDRLALDNRTMEHKIREYQDYAKKDILLQLLHGCFDQTSLMADIGLCYNERTAFAVILVSPTAIPGQERDKLIKRNLSAHLYIQHCLDQRGVAYQILPSYEDAIVVILSDNMETMTDDLLAQLTALLDNPGDEVDSVPLRAFSGNIEYGILGISNSYQFAKEKRSYSLFSQQLCKTQEYDSSRHFYYPTDWEIQLINNLKTANLESANRILCEIRIENEKRELSLAAIGMLLQSIHDTILRVALELNLTTLDNDVEQHMLTHSPDPENTSKQGQQWYWIYSACEVICSRSSYSHSEIFDLSEQMVDYVKKNFTNAEISLKAIAYQFHVSTSTVSNIFKLSANLNFYDYVCRLRMEKAKVLLKETSLPIKDISKAVGYEIEHSFRRAYTRYEGVSPGEYRISYRSMQ